MTAGPFVPFAVTLRGGVAESHHFGVAALVDAAGRVLARWGDADFVTFPRSALKPFQAVDLVESGALDSYGLSAEHLALACASHYGEPAHTERVTEWLGRIGCSEEDLACGPALSSRPELARAYLRGGRSPSTILHNCSGKHTGLLTHARHCGCPIEGYASPDHPLQQRYRTVLSRFLGRPADSLPWSRDDCTLPAPALSMADMAAAAARFVGEAEADAGSAPAHILTAMRHNPLLVAGTGGVPEALETVVPGRMIAKTGAEGYLLVFLPAERLGLTIKVADGCSRAREAVVAAMLNQIGLIDADEAARLDARLSPPLLDSRRRPVGSIRPALPPMVGG